MICSPRQPLMKLSTLQLESLICMIVQLTTPYTHTHTLALYTHGVHTHTQHNIYTYTHSHTHNTHTHISSTRYTLLTLHTQFNTHTLHYYTHAHNTLTRAQETRLRLNHWRHYRHLAQSYAILQAWYQVLYRYSCCHQ